MNPEQVTAGEGVGTLRALAMRYAGYIALVPGAVAIAWGGVETVGAYANTPSSVAYAAGHGDEYAADRAANVAQAQRGIGRMEDGVVLTAAGGAVSFLVFGLAARRRPARPLAGSPS